MNWTTPSAPFGETAPCRKELSFQMRRVKKSIGIPLAAAAVSMSAQMVVGVSSVAPASVAELLPDGPSAARTKPAEATRQEQARASHRIVAISKTNLSQRMETGRPLPHRLRELGD